MQNKLRTLWNEGASAVNAWLGIPSTVTAEIVSRQGFDAITIDLLVERGMVDSPVPECDLVVSGLAGGAARSWSMDRSGSFTSDAVAEPALDRAGIEATIGGAGEYLTFMCTPWGSGERIAIDRDLDGVLDRDE